MHLLSRAEAADSIRLRVPLCRLYGPKPPAAGRRGRPAAIAATCAGTARDLVCQHVLAKGRPVALPGKGASW